MESSQSSKPFNFLLSLQEKSRLEMAADDMAALRNHPLWRRGREPHAAAPFNKNIRQAIKWAFDRTEIRLVPIPKKWLKSYERSLARYHLHPEAKFLGGNYDERGILRRRHIKVLSFQQIGKEAENLEEREYIGESGAELIEHGLMREDFVGLRKHILGVQKKTGISDRALCQEAKVSPRTVNTLRRNRKIADHTIFALTKALERLADRQSMAAADDAEAFRLLKAKHAELGNDAAIAKFLGVDRSYATRLLRGNRPLRKALKMRLRDWNVRH